MKFNKSIFLRMTMILYVFLMIYLNARESSIRYGTLTAGEFVGYYDSLSGGISRKITEASEIWGFDTTGLGDKVTTTDELFKETHSAQFERLLNASLGTFAFAVLFAPYFLGMEFVTRKWNNALYAGHSRTSIYMRLIVEFYLIASLVSLLSTVVMTVMYASSVFGRLPVYYVVGHILRKLLLDVAIISIPVFSIFLIKGTVFPALFSLLTGAATWIVVNIVGKPDLSQLPTTFTANLVSGQTSFNSAVVTPLSRAYLPTLSVYDLPLAVPTVIIAVSVLGSLWRFRRCDLM